MYTCPHIQKRGFARQHRKVPSQQQMLKPLSLTPKEQLEKTAAFLNVRQQDFSLHRK